jgi:hypothetical protein
MCGFAFEVPDEEVDGGGIARSGRVRQRTVSKSREEILAALEQAEGGTPQVEGGGVEATQSVSVSRKGYEDQNTDSTSSDQLHEDEFYQEVGDHESLAVDDIDVEEPEIAEVEVVEIEDSVPEQDIPELQFNATATEDDYETLVEDEVLNDEPTIDEEVTEEPEQEYVASTSEVFESEPSLTDEEYADEEDPDAGDYRVVEDSDWNEPPVGEDSSHSVEHQHQDLTEELDAIAEDHDHLSNSDHVQSTEESEHPSHLEVVSHVKQDDVPQELPQQEREEYQHFVDQRNVGLHGATKDVNIKDAGNQKMSEIGADTLIGWLVSYESAAGVSTELRGAKFFVTREQIRTTDLVVLDDSVSSPHCLVSTHGNGSLVIQDLLSEHGSFVKRNGSGEFQPLGEVGSVSSGDVIRFGGAEFLLVLVP